MTQLPLFDLDITLFPHERADVRTWLRFGRGRSLFSEFSGTKILSVLQQFDLGIRRGDFYEIQRQVLGENQYREFLDVLGKDYYVPRAYWVNNHGMELSTKVIYRFEVEGSVFGTDAHDTRYFSIGANQELTVQQAEDALLSLLAGEAEYYGIIVSKFTLDTMFIQPDFEGSL